MLLPQGRVQEKHKEPDIEAFSFYRDCFFELNTCRSTVALSAIPFTDIHNLARIYEVDDFEEFHYIMRRLDNHYLQVKDKKSNGNSSQDDNNQSGGQGEKGASTSR